MIVVRFFTGVTIQYPDAETFQIRPEGIFLYSGPDDARHLVAFLQSTSGAIVEGDGTRSQIDYSLYQNKKNILKKIFK